MAIEQLVQNAARMSTIQISIAVSPVRHRKPGAAGPLFSKQRLWVVGSLELVLLTVRAATRRSHRPGLALVLTGQIAFETFRAAS